MGYEARWVWIFGCVSWYPPDCGDRFFWGGTGRVELEVTAIPKRSPFVLNEVLGVLLDPYRRCAYIPLVSTSFLLFRCAGLLFSSSWFICSCCI